MKRILVITLGLCMALFTFNGCQKDNQPEPEIIADGSYYSNGYIQLLVNDVKGLSPQTIHVEDTDNPRYFWEINSTPLETMPSSTYIYTEEQSVKIPATKGQRCVLYLWAVNRSPIFGELYDRYVKLDMMYQRR